MIKELINKFLNNEKADLVELREAFEEILSGLCDEITASSFLSLLHNQGFSEDVIALVLDCSKKAIKAPKISLNQENLIENLNQTTDLKYLDISLAQDIICVANNLSVARYSYNTPFLKDNSFNILSFMGVNIEREVDYSTSEYEKLNFNYVFLNESDAYYKYSEKLRNNLPFENIFKQTLKLLNPLGAKNIFLGIKEKNMVDKYASLALKLQKSNSVILANDSDFCYIHPNSETYIAEAWKNKVFTYVLNPELLGMKPAELNEFKVENNEENANSLVEILQNKVKNSRFDLIVLNSALSLYIAKKADSITDGIELAKKTIESGLAADKLEELRKFYN